MHTRPPHANTLPPRTPPLVNVTRSQSPTGRRPSAAAPRPPALGHRPSVLALQPPRPGTVTGLPLSRAPSPGRRGPPGVAAGAGGDGGGGGVR
ncbi:hypothetical protein GEV43_41130 [Actinomadura sp. J1-007]|nr:hypothetical protein [Actinomadura sp. J1-007]